MIELVFEEDGQQHRIHVRRNIHTSRLRAFFSILTKKVPILETKYSPHKLSVAKIR